MVEASISSTRDDAFSSSRATTRSSARESFCPASLAFSMGSSHISVCQTKLASARMLRASCSIDATLTNWWGFSEDLIMGFFGEDLIMGFLRKLVKDKCLAREHHFFHPVE